jgi:hypothetical protein
VSAGYGAVRESRPRPSPSTPLLFYYAGQLFSIILLGPLWAALGPIQFSSLLLDLRLLVCCWARSATPTSSVPTPVHARSSQSNCGRQHEHET